MKRYVMPLLFSIGALLWLFAIITSPSTTMERGLQTLNGVAPLAQPRLSHDALLQKARQHQPSTSHTVHLYTHPSTHPLVLFIGSSPPHQVLRLDTHSGEPLPALTGEMWVNQTQLLAYSWHAQWRRPYWLAGAGLLLFAGMVWWYRPRPTSLPAVAPTDVLLIYASQTGTAEAMAKHLAGQYTQPVHCLPLNAMTPELLQQGQHALFIVSTYGDGDAPDNGATFARRYFRAQIDLSALNFGVLALGDKRYPHFCAFGLQLHEWLAHNGAQALFPAQTHDSQNEHLPPLWVEHLQQAGVDNSAPTQEWHTATLLQRTCLNPHSASPPLYLLQFSFPHGDWAPGDVLHCRIPTHAGTQQREYSIANVRHGQTVELVVRQLHKDDGTLGMGSGWLTRTLSTGDTVQVSVRSNPLFHAVHPQAPCLLIGAGSGIAGLRGHWQHRQRSEQPTWLFYGERSQQHENFLPALLEPSSQSTITTAFSQCSARPQYVQDALLAHRKQVQAWVHQGACLYVCGSLSGMGEGVHQALLTILSDDALQQLQAEGRYRRDLY